jgi:predicted homoserine dehydrogenase-like protein
MRDLKAGEVLDGVGGYMAHGYLVPAVHRKTRRLLPIGLADGIPITCDVPAGTALTENDVNLDPNRPAVQVRREMCNRSGAG